MLLSYNYVCAATDSVGQEVVLKVGVPNPELTSEIEALTLYDGRGAARLIDSDAEHGLLLEQRLQPGTMLLEVPDDDAATEIAAGVMRSLWCPPPANNRLIHLTDWFNGFRLYRQKFGCSGPLPPNVIDTAEALVADFFAENEPPVVLHGDFHHYNVLMAGDSWKVIDPKGVIGPRGYEVGPLLVNPGGPRLHGPDARKIAERRFAILAGQLGLERSRVRGWGIAHAALSAWWSMDAQGRGGEDVIHCAEVFLSIPE
jgi:streptomycin 6-kinase